MTAVSRALVAVFAAPALLLGAARAHRPSNARAADAPPAVAADDSAVVLAAGDVAFCDDRGRGARQTAAMLDTLAGEVLALGDLAYMHGSADEFRDCFGPAWGRFLGRIHPAPGNHEYETPDAAGYFGYFGARAGPAGQGWYSFTLGAWHVVSLNSNVDMSPGSPQEQWLRADLAANPPVCTLAFWHHPRFSSGRHGPTREVEPLWRALAEAGVELVLQGHDHDYERFAPMDADGNVDQAWGVRSFVVGTGGAPLRDSSRPARGSEVRSLGWGLLRLTLRPDSYGWQMLADGHDEPVDEGEGLCH